MPRFGAGTEPSFEALAFGPQLHGPTNWVFRAVKEVAEATHLARHLDSRRELGFDAICTPHAASLCDRMTPLSSRGDSMSYGSRKRYMPPRSAAAPSGSAG